MRLLSLLSVLSVAIVLCLAAGSPRVAAQAQVPTHNVGDAAGFGATLDLTSLATPFLNQLRSSPNVTVHQLDFTGSADFWVHQEVAAKSATTYTIHTDSAMGVKAHLVLNITSNQLPAPGMYPGTIDPVYQFCRPPIVPYTTRNVFLEFQIAHLDASSADSHWDISTFALRDSTSNSTVDLRAITTMRGVPSTDFNATACKETITYQDADLTLTANVAATLRVAYSPALDVFNFPINDNETWYANSTATTAGHISGTISLVGLDATKQRQFFENLTKALNSQPGLQVKGLTGFPIVLENITVTIGTVDYLKNGDIRDYTAPASAHIHARQATKTLADGSFHTVYLLSQAAAPGPPTSTTGPVCSWVYSPDNGFIVGYTCEVQGVAIFELKNVPPNTAKDNIEKTKTNYAVNPSANPPTTTTFADFFAKPPYSGILILLAVGIVAAALLFWRGRRRRPAVAPPMPPTETPPPQGPAPPNPPTGP